MAVEEHPDPSPELQKLPAEIPPRRAEDRGLANHGGFKLRVKTSDVQVLVFFVGGEKNFPGFALWVQGSVFLRSKITRETLRVLRIPGGFG